MSAATKIASAVAFVQTAEPPRKKRLLRSYPKDDSYLLRQVANDQTIAKRDFAILRQTHLTSMARMQYADDLYMKSWNEVDVYEESILNGIFPENASCFICLSIRKY